MYDKCIKEPNPRGTENCRNAIDANVHSGNITSSKVKIGNPNITLLFYIMVPYIMAPLNITILK